MYYTYMIRCADNSIYTGITTDLERRLNEHITKDKKCAKYTYFHTATKMETAWKSMDRMHASKLEYWIKTLSKQKKEELIKYPNLLEELLSKKIEIKEYENIKTITKE